MEPSTTPRPPRLSRDLVILYSDPEGLESLAGWILLWWGICLLFSLSGYAITSTIRILQDWLPGYADTLLGVALCWLGLIRLTAMRQRWLKTRIVCALLAMFWWAFNLFTVGLANGISPGTGIYIGFTVTCGWISWRLTRPDAPPPPSGGRLGGLTLLPAMLPVFLSLPFVLAAHARQPLAQETFPVSYVPVVASIGGGIVALAGTAITVWSLRDQRRLAREQAALAAQQRAGLVDDASDRARQRLAGEYDTLFNLNTQLRDELVTKAANCEKEQETLREQMGAIGLRLEIVEAENHDYRRILADNGIPQPPPRSRRSPRAQDP